MAMEDGGNHQLAASCTMAGGACRTCFAPEGGHDDAAERPQTYAGGAALGRQ
jgi:hypothetical protein